MQRSFASRAAWRAWLAKNHAKAREIWLVYYKRGSGKASVDYPASVEEALCFGWIDGIKKRVDDERYMHRFSPRKASSLWSAVNIARAERMIAQGKMTPAGAAAFAKRKRYDERTRAALAAADAALTPEIEKAMRANAEAWKNFRALPPGQRKYYVLWLTTAKKPETRRKRLAEAISLLERNEKLGMK